MPLFKATVESMLLYGSDSRSLTKSLEKKLDSTYTLMLSKVHNIPCKDNVTNSFLYGSNPRLTEIIRRKRLSLASNRLLVWLVTCQDTMSQLPEFCYGNLMSGEEWAAPKLP